MTIFYSNFFKNYMAAKSFKIALAQYLVSGDKSANIRKAVSKIAEAANQGAKIIVLPESFNAPYGHEYFRSYSEKVPGPSTDALAEAARKHQVYLIGGSLIEAVGEKLYNTCPVYNPSGQLATTHRKVHMFDIDVPGGIRFIESETISPGQHATIFETEFCKIGLGICYDIRFPEMARLYVKEGCELLVYPGCFNMTTGPAHWELLARARALDCQTYMAVCSLATDKSASYVAWGHSMVTDPWGGVVASADDSESTIYATIGKNLALFILTGVLGTLKTESIFELSQADSFSKWSLSNVTIEAGCNLPLSTLSCSFRLDLNRVKEVRKQISTTTQRRSDLYETVKNADIVIGR